MLGFNLSVGRNRQSFGDADAQAFITATGLTGATETTAVRRLVSNLKTYGLWSKMKAIYPFVSDTYNLINYSENFSSWSSDGATNASDVTTAPNGTLTADTINDGTAVNRHINYQTFSGDLSLSRTLSVYAKQNALRYLVLSVTTPLDANFYSAIFDLQTGTVSATKVYGTGTINASIVNAGNGWYRCIISGTLTTGTGTFYPMVGTSDRPGFTGGLSANNIPIYPGTNITLYVWGAQLEQSSSATTYQPIATTPANRFVSQFKYNLKDPRDLDAAFRLAFNGTWAYSKQGATPNGVNGYANTYLNPVAQGLTTASAHLSYYARTSASTADPAEMGNYTNNSIGFVIQSKSSLGTNLYYYSYPIGASRAVATAPTGLIAGSSIANTRRDLYLNGVSVANNTSTDSGTLGNYNLYIGAANINNTSVASYTNSQTGFSSIGNGLTDSEMANYYTSVQQFNQDLSRQVGVPIVSDSDAQSFLNAAQITDLTQANAINTLVVGLKNASLWTKMKAIYPFVGGTATSHKWNLKDPRDLDAAYRLAFYGAWTHSSTGALPNGVNAYADTFLNMASVLTNNNNHMSFYSRTNSLGGFKFEMGVTDNTTHSNQIGPNYNGTNALYENGSTIVSIANANTTGMYIGSTTSSTSGKLYKNNTVLGSSTTLNTYSLFSNKMYLSATNISTTNTATYYSNREKAFTTIGDGLNDSEASTLYTLVQNFQTTLGRQV